MKGCECAQLGFVKGSSLEITGVDGGKAASLAVKDLEEAYKKTLRDY